MIFLIQEYVGTVREFLIALDAIQLAICIELTMFFLFRGLKNKQTLKINIGWGLVYLCFSYIVAFNIWRIFYATEVAITTLSKINFLLPLLSTIILMEYLLQRYQKTWYIFSILGIALSLIYILIPEVAGNLFTNTTLVILLVFGILFFGKFIKLSKGIVRKYVLLFTFSFFLVIIGWMLISPRNTDLFLLNLGMDPIVHGTLARGVQIGSFILMAAVLLKLPIFFEVNWRENLIQLYIVVRDRGVPIFHTRFQENDLEDSRDDMEEDLVAGGMAGITAMLKEISQSTEELKIIDHGDLKIILEHGDNFFIALLAKEEMNIYWDRVKQLHRTIERLFGNILKAWDGNLAYFEPLKTIVRDDFQ